MFIIQFQNEHLTVFQSSLFMTTSALIQSEEVFILIDPTWLPHEVKRIQNYVDQHIGDRRLYILYTHSDFDHILGSGAFPRATVIATEQLANHPNKEQVMQQVQQFDQTYYVERTYTPVYPSVDIAVSSNGQTLVLGEVTLTFYLAPGHTNDCLFTVVEPYGVFLSGDYLSDVEFPFIFSNYHDYLTTIQTAKSIMREHRIRTHVPGHGTTTQEEQEIHHRLHFSEYYLEKLVDESPDLEHELRDKYTFYEGMKTIHFDNQQMAKQRKE